MLVLTRKLGKSLVVGDDIKVTVLSVKNNSVSLGITAPDDTAVHREEVYLRIESQHCSESKTKFNSTVNSALTTKK